MVRINRKVEYALMALKHMQAKPAGQLSSAKEISGLYGAPFDAISRVLQTLAHHQILRSEQGAQGGYQIVKDLRKVSLFEVIEILLGPLEIARCLHMDDDEDTCAIRSTCNIISPIAALNDKVSEFYKQLTVAELIMASNGSESGVNSPLSAASSESEQPLRERAD